MLNGKRYAARFWVLSIFAMAWATTAAATVYHVGPAQGYTQLAQVADLLDPGDTVLVDGDATYQSVSFTRAGSAQAPIVIRGQRINGNRPVISGGTNTVAFISAWPYDSGADHYVFEGFEVTGGSSRGVYHQSGDLTVRDVLVRDCPMHGILGADQGAGSCLLEFVEVRHCGQGGSRHQIYMSTDQVNRPGSVFRMRHCYLHDGNGGNNVKSRAERNEIHYNWIEGGYYHELELIGPDPDGVAPGWYHDLAREDSDVVGNVLRKRRTAAGNDSNFAVTRIGGDATGWTHGRYRFVNNTVICGTGAVFRCFDTLESVEMHNNVFYRIGGGINMMRTVEAGWVHDTAVIAGSNNWVYSGAINVPSQWTGTIFGTDPGFADYSSGDVRPATGSPLVNAGNPAPASIPGMGFPSPTWPPSFQPPLRQAATAAAVRPAVAMIDIGAFECDPTGVAGGGAMPRPWRPALAASPNPFSSSASVRYELPVPGRVRIVVYSVAGQRVRVLADADRPAGRHEVDWDGRDGRGGETPAGLYLIELRSGNLRSRVSLVKVR